ncbi:LPXTG cell wall anchor domain-containing protein [Brochothrix campestris]|uniref:LPXTG cell wall anchor domain-containing protein n=1 Tax=Brochothrix campestris TaxID=2757 RepID=UPI0004B02014|nr:LPXTG cell wall anchor domain-containing protein [Brochothrix campestris]
MTFIGSKQSNSVRVVYGSSTATASIDEQVEVEWIDSKTFKIPLRDTNERIFITYKTKTDFSKSQYTNTAEVTAKIDGASTLENHHIIGYSEKYGGEGGGNIDSSSNDSSSSNSSSTDSSSIDSSSTDSSSTDFSSSDSSSNDSNSDAIEIGSNISQEKITHTTKTHSKQSLSNLIITPDSSENQLKTTISQHNLPKTGENQQLPWYLWVGLTFLLIAVRQIKKITIT